MGIDANQLVLDIEHLALSGIVLSIEQRASLQTSLSIAREQYKFDRIYLWGKILGTKEDYFGRKWRRRGHWRRHCKSDFEFFVWILRKYLEETKMNKLYVEE